MTTTSTEADMDLDAMRARAEAARRSLIGVTLRGPLAVQLAHVITTDIPTLLAEVERLRTAIRAMRPIGDRP